MSSSGRRYRVNRVNSRYKFIFGVFNNILVIFTNYNLATLIDIYFVFDNFKAILAFINNFWRFLLAKYNLVTLFDPFLYLNITTKQLWLFCTI